MNENNKIITSKYYSIRRKIVIWMVVVVCCLVLPIDMFDYYQTKQEMQDDLRRLTEQKVLRLAENVKLPLWELDADWVEKVILAEMYDENVFAIRVESENKIIVGKAKNIQNQLVDFTTDIDEQSLQRKIEITYKDAKIGLVYLYMTDQFINDKLLSVAKFKIFKGLILIFLLVGALNILLRRMILMPLQKILVIVNEIAGGNYKHSVGQVDENDEIGVLTTAMHKMSSSLNQAAEAAIAVAAGDYSQLLEVRSEKDLFALSMNKMIMSLKDVVKQIENVSLGDYEKPFEPRSNTDVLGFAMQRMTAELISFNQQQREQIWLEKSVASLNDVLRKETTAEALAAELIALLAQTMGGKVAALFLVLDKTEHKHMYLAASYAYVGDIKKEEHIYQIGEGIVGQAAKDQNRIIIDNIDDGDIKITTGFGQFFPKTLVVNPFSFNHQIRGVIEIGFNYSVSAMDLLFLDRVQEAIASAFERIYVKQNLSQTLQREQVFSEELQVVNEELLSKAEELERQTITLKEAQEISLKRAKALEENNNYKSAFLANMSHELRTPLNSLLILAQLLVDDEHGHMTDDQVESAQIIQSSGKHLLRLINEILELSKLEAGYTALKPADIDVANLVEVLQQRFTPLAKEKNLQLNVQPPNELPEVFVSDVEILDQILTNLLANAIKFTDNGTVSLSVRCISKDRLDKSVEKCLLFEVVDTGIGISKEQIKQIFFAFHQVDGSFSRRYGGTGLGLSIAVAYAKLLGGSIDVESEIGKGSTFRLVIPFKLPNQVIKTQEDKQSIVISQNSLSGVVISAPPFEDDRYLADDTNSFILVLEDDEKFAKILYRQVTSKGYKCIVCSNAESTIQLVKQYPISGIILDLCLPGMDGKTFLAELNAMSNVQHIPVHIISVLDDDGECWNEGVVGYLTKPVTQAQISDALKVLKHFDPDGLRRILIVEEDKGLQQELMVLLNNEQVNIDICETMPHAMDMLAQKTFDCIVLDIEFVSQQGAGLLDQIIENKTTKTPLIIIYTAREINEHENSILTEYAERVVIHYENSPERLKDEVLLFLHQVKYKKQQEGGNFLAYNGDLRLSGKKIMIVDDDMRNSYALAKVLRSIDVNVIIVSSGQEALDKLAENIKVDLILMDIMMPKMDGYEVMKDIRLQEKFKSLPIIAVTAKAMPNDKEHCLQAGANDYLVKPIDLNQLMTMVRAWIMS